MTLSFPLPTMKASDYTRLVMLIKHVVDPSWRLTPYVNLGEGDITTLYIDDVAVTHAQVIINTVWGIIIDIMQ